MRMYYTLEIDFYSIYHKKNMKNKNKWLKIRY